MINVLKFRTCFSFCSLADEMLVIRAEVHKKLARTANRKDLGQSDLGLLCYSRPFWHATSDQQNLRASPVYSL